MKWRRGWFLIFILCVIFVLYPAQNSISQNVLEEHPLQGCVRSVYELMYKVSVEKGVIGKGECVSEIVDTIHYNKDGSLLNTPVRIGSSFQNDSIVYLYDTQGRCNKIAIYYPDKKLRESRTLVYNELGRLKLCIIRSTNEEVVDAISYTYDSYGKLAIKIYNRKDGEMHQQRFAYDTKGNWIVRVDFNEYEPVYYVERQIEYYPD